MQMLQFVHKSGPEFVGESGIERVQVSADPMGSQPVPVVRRIALGTRDRWAVLSDVGKADGRAQHRSRRIRTPNSWCGALETDSPCACNHRVTRNLLADGDESLEIVNIYRPQVAWEWRNVGSVLKSESVREVLPPIVEGRRDGAEVCKWWCELQRDGEYRVLVGDEARLDVASTASVLDVV